VVFQITSSVSLSDLSNNLIILFEIETPQVFEDPQCIDFFNPKRYLFIEIFELTKRNFPPIFNFISHLNPASEHCGKSACPTPLSMDSEIWNSLNSKSWLFIKPSTL